MVKVELVPNKATNNPTTTSRARLLGIRDVLTWFLLTVNTEGILRPVTTIMNIQAPFQSHMIQNNGSTARDFCMLERNLLSHLKLALLLSLLSSSVLLRARLVPDPGDEPEVGESAGIPLAGVQVAASLAAIAAGAWEYHSGYRDLRNMRAFLVAAKFVPFKSLLSIFLRSLIVALILLL